MSNGYKKGTEYNEGNIMTHLKLIGSAIALGALAYYLMFVLAI